MASHLLPFFHNVRMGQTAVLDYSAEIPEGNGDSL
jgi:hypothetical protein